MITNEQLLKEHEKEIKELFIEYIKVEKQELENRKLSAELQNIILTEFSNMFNTAKENGKLTDCVANFANTYKYKLPLQSIYG